MAARDLRMSICRPPALLISKEPLIIIPSIECTTPRRATRTVPSRIVNLRIRNPELSPPRLPEESDEALSLLLDDLLLEELPIRARILTTGASASTRLSSIPPASNAQGLNPMRIRLAVTRVSPSAIRIAGCSATILKRNEPLASSHTSRSPISFRTISFTSARRCRLPSVLFRYTRPPPAAAAATMITIIPISRIRRIILLYCHFIACVTTCLSSC